MAGPDVLTPQEIASYLCDAGRIDRTTASILEQRIVAYAESTRAEGRIEGITAALKKAEAAVSRTRGDRQRGSAGKVLAAVRGLLPPEAAVQQEIAKARSQGYQRGYRDGKQSRGFTPRSPKGRR